MYKQPTLRDYFRDKQEVVVVRREYRKMYKINWRRFFKNVYKMIAFWKPAPRRFMLPSIERNLYQEDEFLIRKEVIEGERKQ